MEKKKINKLLKAIISNANWILGSWRVGSDEVFFVSEIKKDAREIFKLLYEE